MTGTILIKVGGAALRNPDALPALCEKLKELREAGIPLVIVHGGGPSIDAELKLHGIEWKFIDGQRVTTPEMMKTVERVLCGEVNPTLVRALNRVGISAVGLSGSDAQMLQCTQASPELGQVGRIEKVDTRYLGQLLTSQKNSNEGFVPVIAPVGYGEDGAAYNINADWAAVRIGQALGVEKVIFLTDQDGILDDEKALIPSLDSFGLEGLIRKGVLQGGMLAKARTILYSLRHGISEVQVTKNPLALEKTGTLCRELL